jgi:hypothetical protein
MRRPASLAAQPLAGSIGISIQTDKAAWRAVRAEQRPSEDTVGKSRVAAALTNSVANVQMMFVASITSP